MKYKTEVVIDLPRARVIELFDSTENLYKWQEGLKSHTHLEGEPGQAGAKMELVYEVRGRESAIVETITKNGFPDAFVATYEAKGVWNLHENSFYAEDGKTRWVTDTEFRCKGIVWLMTVVMPGMFKRQTLKDMNAFKAFAESQ